MLKQIVLNSILFNFPQLVNSALVLFLHQDLQFNAPAETYNYSILLRALKVNSQLLIQFKYFINTENETLFLVIVILRSNSK